VAGDAPPAERALQQRSRSVLHAAKGKGNREIGKALHLSETTVKRHLSNVYEKLGVRSRGEATSRALAEGWISSQDLAREQQEGREGK
jgi:DNA-binding NarL/FixJ family response regulator